MFITITRFIVVLAASLVLAGCKLALVVPAGGEVVSASGTRNCDGGGGGQFCTFDLSSVSLPFSETFTASAKPGYQFVRWQAGQDFQCAGSTNPVCNVTLGNNPAGILTLASYDTRFLMPVFRDVGFDTDGDGIFDRQDPDDDNDGILDENDPCPLSLVCGEETIQQLVLDDCAVSGNTVLQSFTATRTGQLTAISFAAQSSYLNQLVTTIYRGAGTTGQQLYSEFGVMDAGPATALRSIAIYFNPVPVTAGQVYTVQLYAGSAGAWTVCGSALNPYPDGAATGSGLTAGWDLGFSVTIEY